jgi:hypothetical protein
VKSVRLAPDLEARLREAARIVGVSESAFIRDALDTRINEVLSQRLDRRLAPMIGVIDSDVLVADRASEAFADFLVEDHQKQSRPASPDLPGQSSG